jgi:hypothetical protein
LASKVLFERVDTSTLFIANRAPFPKELDSIDYYKKRPELAKQWLAHQDTIPNPNPYTDKIKQYFNKQLHKDSLNNVKKKSRDAIYNNLKRK